MILNASHEITNCGLPQHVQERYVRYKQGNRAIVAWMTSYGPDKYKGHKTLPIKQMVALGRLLCDKLQDIGTLPPDVDYYFRDVIKERAYLSQHFRHFRDQSERDDVETINHEHFTESLKQIHQILLTAGSPSLFKSAKVGKRQTRSCCNSDLSFFQHGSRFSSIPSDGTGLSEESDVDTLSDDGTDATSECSHSVSELVSDGSISGDQHEDFLDDSGSFARGIETLAFLNKIEMISKLVRTCWSGSHQWGTNTTASTVYTNVLVQQAIRHCHDFTESQPAIVNFHLIQQIAEEWYSNSNHIHREADCRHTLLELSCVLTAIERSYSLFYSEESQPPRLLTDPTSHDLINRLVADLSVLSITCPEPVFTFEWLRYCRGMSSHTTDHFAKCVVLHIIATSHCSYSGAISSPGSIAMPRISALKLGNEALSTVRKFISDKSVFPCQCTNTLGYRIIQMQDELERFVKFRCWNTLMQSPLVAGNHVLEILDLCSYYGMHLFHYRHYVGAVLHTYNALAHLKMMDKIAILDELVELFTPVLFTTGKCPDSGFMASWLRYIGARLKFKSGKKHQNHRDTWCMSIPAHTAARSAGLDIGGRNDPTQIQPKFDYGTIDPTMKLKRSQWVLNNEQQQQLDLSLESSDSTFSNLSDANSQEQPTARTVKSKTRRRSKHNFNEACIGTSIPSSCGPQADATSCSDVHHSILSNFLCDGSLDGKTLPPSRFNLLSLFHSMTKVIAGISDTTHETPAQSVSQSYPSSNSGKGQMCLCFTQTILRAADRIMDTRKTIRLDAKGATWSRNERECVECFKIQLLKVLDEDGITSEKGVGGATGGRWLWESVP